MRIVVVEPYFVGSHRAWAEGYRDHSRHEVHLATHPGAFWKWRMHGGALTLARLLRRTVSEAGPVDAVLVSDMVNVAALLGLCRDALGDAAVVSYFHENQLTYPLAPRALPDVSFGVVNWLSMAAADEVWFNSRFHLEELRRALPVLLGSFPDQRHTDLLGGVLDRARVMPVGVDLVEAVPRRGEGPPVLLWNQRWEHDKDPLRFLAAVDRLAATGRGFRLALAGPGPRRVPELEAALDRHRDRVVHAGEAPRGAYEAVLGEADVVVSTARHEFFGVSVTEAVGAGAAPVLPAALAYPELVGPEEAGECLYHDDAGLDLRLQRFVDDPALRRAVAGRLAASVRERFSWPVVAARYDERVEQLRSSS